MKLHEEERAARHALGNQLQKDLVPRLVRVEERQQTTLDKLDEVKALVEKLG
jgi:ribosomal protein L17